MPYHMDDQVITLVDLQKRLETTDLIPSQEPLLDHMTETMRSLKNAGIATVRDLRAALKTPKAVAALAKASGVAAGYLNLLRRTVEGFFPAPRPLAAFDWINKKLLNALAQQGIQDTATLYSQTENPKQRKALAGAAGLDADTLLELHGLADLSRVQWVSPSFARTMMAAGYDNAAKIAKADPENLCERIATANATYKYYKGKVGLRDVRRLVMAAKYVG